jgi:hypothetical protein
MAKSDKEYYEQYIQAIKECKEQSDYEMLIDNIYEDGFNDGQREYTSRGDE